MTYQEHFLELQKDYQDKADKFLKLDKIVSSVSGFGDMKDMSDYIRAKTNGNWLLTIILDLFLL